MASGLDDTRKEIYIMENFTLEEVKILLSSFKKHGLDLLTDRIQRHGSEDNAERYVTKDVRDLILYEKLLEKLSRYVTNETKNQKKLKLATGITTTKPKDVTPETGIPFVSDDDELRKQLIDGTLVDPKLETTLFPNGKPSK